MAERLNMYGLLFLAGIVLTAWVWGRFSKVGGAGHDGRLTIIYFCGLLGALIGAKLAFLLAEGWHYRDNWIALLSGRSITGALLGGYAAVEIAKQRLGYAQATGDAFALVAPLGIMLGRIGCLLQGCCPGRPCASPNAWWAITDDAGVARWPAAGVELLFNAAFLAWALLAQRNGWQRGNRFHVYLIAYGLFRFGHEFLRDDVRVGVSPLGGYHILALAIAALGAWRYLQRRAENRCAAPIAGRAPAAIARP